MEKLDQSRDVAVDRTAAFTKNLTLGGSICARRPGDAFLMNYYDSLGNLPMITMSVLPPNDPRVIFSVSGSAPA